MRASANCLALIKAFESLVDGNTQTPNFEPYVCPARIYTVGWGHVLLTPAGEQIDIDKFGAGAAALAADAMMRKFGKLAITREEADALLEADIIVFENGVSKIVAADTTQTEFDAFVSFAFNTGVANFNSSTLKRLHNENHRAVGSISLHDLCEVAKKKTNPVDIATGFTAWSYSSGKFLLGLFRRRAAELLLYTGWDAAKAYETVEAFTA